MDSDDKRRAEFDGITQTVDKLVEMDESKIEQSDSLNRNVEMEMDVVTGEQAESETYMQSQVNVENVYAMQGARPKTSTPLQNQTDTVGHKDVEKSIGHIAGKIDQMLDMMSGMRQDIDRVDRLTKDSEENQQKRIDSHSKKLNESVHFSISEAFGNVQKDLKMKIENAVSSKVDEEIKHIGINVKKDIKNNMNNKINEAVEQKTDWIVNNIDQKIDQKISEKMDKKVEQLVEERIEGRLEHFQEQLWRKTNVLIANLPESRSKNVEDRQVDDLEDALNIFNKFVTMGSEHIEGLPVRLGRISDRPRLLRVTLRSEKLVNVLVAKARDGNHILNPNEKDGKKKIYINKDYTYKDRQERQILLKEKKELEAKGVKVDIRKGKLIPRVQIDGHIDRQLQNDSQNRRYRDGQESQMPMNENDRGRDRYKDRQGQNSSQNERYREGQQPMQNNGNVRHNIHYNDSQSRNRREGQTQQLQNSRNNYSHDSEKFRSPMNRTEQSMNKDRQNSSQNNPALGEGRHHNMTEYPSYHGPDTRSQPQNIINWEEVGNAVGGQPLTSASIWDKFGQSEERKSQKSPNRDRSTLSRGSSYDRDQHPRSGERFDRDQNSRSKDNKDKERSERERRDDRRYRQNSRDNDSFRRYDQMPRNNNHSERPYTRSQTGRNRQSNFDKEDFMYY